MPVVISVPFKKYQRTRPLVSHWFQSSWRVRMGEVDEISASKIDKAHPAAGASRAQWASSARANRRNLHLEHVPSGQDAQEQSQRGGAPLARPAQTARRSGRPGVS